MIPEKIGCIEIRDNVFIGSRTVILGNVRIGSNVIVAAGSLVNRDLPDNSVVAGVPARVVGRFDDFVQKRLTEKRYESGVTGQIVSKKQEEYFWSEFEMQRKK
ncbi:MAG: hypothetical protein Q4C61_03465 [Lachnospiraceae bacterium]|nr:hypothetical protein [Lachnospiraceae bacterium]